MPRMYIRRLKAKEDADAKTVAERIHKGVQSEVFALGEAELQIGRSLGLFKQIYNLIRKLMSYVEHCILQLHCIMNKKEANFKLLFKNNASMHLLVKLIGRALKLIYVIDCLVNSN